MLTDDCSDLAAHEAGDSQAFTRLYDRHAAVVLSFCRRGAGGVGHGSEDAMQETFIRAHGKLKRVDDCRGFRSWLLTIAGFVTRERRRSAARYAAHVGAAAQHAASTGHIAGSSTAQPTPVEAAERRDALDRLSSALDRLPDDERLAIHLQYLEHDPIAAAKSALGLSRSGFYALLARAREHLAQLMSTEVTA
ncbi:MAG: sigma-70 family RNA polymerase sigma factor [Phycisphaerae bacterium]|nr:sigma-70 family RNA polymerase sigma factor [Phycisphaerae bacterium]